MYRYVSLLRQLCSYTIRTTEMRGIVHQVSYFSETTWRIQPNRPYYPSAGALTSGHRKCHHSWLMLRIFATYASAPGGPSNRPSSDSLTHRILLYEPRFQPNLNRRFGAVVLFTRVNQLQNANIIRGYRVLGNTHAHRPVPEAVLNAIANLDESPW